MSILSVELGDRSYPIYIDSNILNRPELMEPFCTQQILVVTNTTVGALYGVELVRRLSACADKVEILQLPDGESYKNLDTINLIFDCLLEKTFNRQATLVALGGGVVGDMTGFAAACYQRGVKFVQVPTTLLSQVDSSVGGKTGVNHRLGKNMIGAFYQPQSVFIDVDVLNTLPQRELSAGLAEVIKYGLIYDADFFDWIENNIDALLSKDSSTLIYAIEQSCRIKSVVVSEDEHESGIRAILNLGHTFGHAIEAVQGYGNWLHGEAVGVGMVMACEMSQNLGWIDARIVDRARTLIARAGLPVVAPDNMTATQFLDVMAVDKKNVDGAIRLVMLKALGQAVVTSDYPLEALMAVLPR